jgi:hypothetical protein
VRNPGNLRSNARDDQGLEKGVPVYGTCTAHRDDQGLEKGVPVYGIPALHAVMIGTLKKVYRYMAYLHCTP